MDHLRFQSNQTAAAYVADGLDHETQEAFELHMMSCPDCVQEVEVWRSLQGQLAANAPCTHEGEGHEAHGHSAQPAREHARRRAPARAATTTSSNNGGSGRALARFRLAAVLVGVGLASGAGGWYARAAHGVLSDAERVDFYNLRVMRGAECDVVKLGAQASVLAVRVPGLDLSKPEPLVLRDSQEHELTPADYSVRAQSDGSWLVRVRADLVRQQGLKFVSLTDKGDEEPRGCIVSSPSE
jgi:Putative zinc-finger